MQIRTIIEGVVYEWEMNQNLKPKPTSFIFTESQASAMGLHCDLIPEAARGPLGERSRNRLFLMKSIYVPELSKAIQWSPMSMMDGDDTHRWGVITSQDENHSASPDMPLALIFVGSRWILLPDTGDQDRWVSIIVRHCQSLFIARCSSAPRCSQDARRRIAAAFYVQRCLDMPYRSA